MPIAINAVASRAFMIPLPLMTPSRPSVLQNRPVVRGRSAAAQSLDPGVLRGVVCYLAAMTKDQVKEILDRVLSWPPERQADLAHVAELMEEQDKSALQLTEEQLAEVRRRRAEKNPKSVTLAEFNQRLRRRYGV